MHKEEITIKMKSTVTKKFMNHPADMVDESLHAMVATDPTLYISPKSKRVVAYRPVNKPHEESSTKVNGYGERSGRVSNVVLLEKANQKLPYFLWGAERQRHGKVSLISGGGSGHEPYCAGYVGQGMLTAAVAGSIFASPPSSSIQVALDEVRSDSGAILFVNNYTGDRLNFGLAAERSRKDGNDVRIVTIADDIAVEGSRIGARGLAGSVFILKIAGAMAENMCSIEEIEAYSKRTIKALRTFGVSLAACSLPGQSPIFHLKEDEMEVGLGIHGEAGRERAKVKSAHDIVDMMMGSLIGKETASKKIILLNNFGGVTNLEMNVIKGEVLRWCDEHDVELVRLCTGTYMTSLDGHGISISVLDVIDNQILEYLDAPTTAKGWNSGVFEKLSLQELRAAKVSASAKLAGSDLLNGKTDQPEDPFVRKLVEKLCEEMKKKEHYLNKLDAAAGDGDCGSTFREAADGIQKSIKEGSFPLSSFQNAAEAAGIIFENQVGGTSGAIYALFLSVLSGQLTEIFSQSVIKALDKATEAIEKYGGAREGDRTMIDALRPVIRAGSSKEIDWNKIAEAAQKGAEATRDLRAAAGRASYTSAERQTEPDSGAMAIAHWIATIVNVAQENV